LELRNSTNSSALQCSELRCNTQSCAKLDAELRAALQRSSTNSSEPRCNVAPRRAQSRAAAQLHKEGDDSCPSPSSSWGCAAAPCFIFLVALRCNIVAFFFLFSLLRYRATVTFLYGGDFFFFALLLLML
jgi:hypothetical protein